MSTNRTIVKLVAAEAVASPEPVDLPLHLVLPGLEPRELGPLVGNGAEVFADVPVRPPGITASFWRISSPPRRSAHPVYMPHWLYSAS